MFSDGLDLKVYIKRRMLLLLILLFLIDSAWTQCDRITGPPGRTSCVLLSPYYYQYQWSTCLTDVYIKLKSRHQHQCIDRTTIYCWYQCMIEVHNKGIGAVSSDCSCSPRHTTPAYPPTSLLPPQCYSPSGESCDWYRQCLEKKHPCEPTTNGYAIRFAEKFCNLYDKHYSWFTADGKKWINGVRKCLQVALVDLLRPWNKPTCKEIRQKAFASHIPCYLKPDAGVPSVCDLKCYEYLAIFWVIKGSFVDMDTAGESIKGMWNIGRQCGVRWIAKITLCTHSGLRLGSKLIRVIWIGTKILRKNRSRRSTDVIPESDAGQRLADRITSAAAKTLKWNKEIMDWFAYSDNSRNTTEDQFNIVIILADKKALNLTNSTAAKVDFSATVEKFAAAIRDGKLPVRVEGETVWIKSLHSCSDTSCNNKTTMAVSEKLPDWVRHNTGTAVELCYVINIMLSLLVIGWNIIN